MRRRYLFYFLIEDLLPLCFSRRTSNHKTLPTAGLCSWAPPYCSFSVLRKFYIGIVGACVIDLFLMRTRTHAHCRHEIEMAAFERGAAAASWSWRYPAADHAPEPSNPSSVPLWLEGGWRQSARWWRWGRARARWQVRGGTKGWMPEGIF